MDGTPENTVILHWDELRTAWTTLPWCDWVQFRGFGNDGVKLLVGAQPGEHYFLVCMVGKHGELYNVIPHRYAMTSDARLVYGFDGLELAERQELCRLEMLALPTIEEAKRHSELYDRGFVANLPPRHTVQPLLRTLPGLAGAPLGAACWHFLSAIGVCHTNARAH
jgi:hypothetical protein